MAGPLGSHVGGKELGQASVTEPGLLLAPDPDTVPAPDVAFVSREQLAARRGYPAWPSKSCRQPALLPPCNRKGWTGWLPVRLSSLVVNREARHGHVYRRPAIVAMLGVDDELDAAEVVPG